MGLVNIITIISLAFGFLYIRYLKPSSETDMNQKEVRIKYYFLFSCILIVSFIIRTIAAVSYFGYESDMNCFIGWADRLSKVGFHKFYSKEVFTDYPPGYMFVLFLLGKIRDHFQLDYYSDFYVFLVKLPAILCDLITGSLLFYLAKKHFRGKNALIIASLYLLNPAIIINSSTWGQVDSVFTLAVILMIYFIYTERLPIAYFVYGLGILIKPQILIFTPVLVFAIIDQIFLVKFSIQKFLKNLISGLIAIALIFGLASFYGLNNVIHQYTDTISSYPYATTNAYNLWTMLGLNWAPQSGKLLFLTYQQWGMLFIILILSFATYLNFKLKDNKSKYFFVSAIIIIGFFTLSVRMHERYVYPALILLIATYCIRPRKQIIWLYSILSTIHLYNVSYVLFKYDVNNFSNKEMVPILIAILMVIFFAYIIYYSLQYKKEQDSDAIVKMSRYSDNTKKIQSSKNAWTKYSNRIFGLPILDHKNESSPILGSKKNVRLAKIDIIIMLIITVIYSCFALYDLGDRKAPETSWETNITDDSITIDLGDKKDISKISYYLGNYENRMFDVQVADTLEGPYSDVELVTFEAVFRWGTFDVNSSARYVKLISKSGNMSLKELVILDSNNKMITPVNRSDENVRKLFDEQSMYPKRSTFRDSTYFDEIYHARTAYEYLHGLYSYENTHPPLGKIFIALGMVLFGVNPFGWRIMGTLFGIVMVPVIYLLAKKLLKETWLSTIVCIIFTFDFMHFTQTRIATIDVFVTFFIMLMYYFMYQYIRLSFYDTKLTKTFVPLGLSGLTMGLGIACKWTGIYAAAGLAIIFFLCIFQRYKEYRYALKKKGESTNGILHDDIITGFYPKLIKTLLFCVLVFLVIPLSIYIMAYIPFRDGTNSGLITRMINNQFSMYNYHSHVNATHPYSSWWYQWPVMYRPIWYYSGHISDTISEGISAFGNPLVWWTGIPAFLYLVYLALCKKDKPALILCISYLAQYVPWFLVTRITFIYHYFPSTPFVTLMIGYSIKNIVDQRPKLKKAAYVYAVLVIILFIMFYPVLSGEPVNKNYVSTWLRWFNSWVLVT